MEKRARAGKLAAGFFVGDCMSAQIIPFVPKPRQRDLSLITPADIFDFYPNLGDLSIGWMMRFAALDTAPAEMNPDESA